MTKLFKVGPTPVNDEVGPSSPAALLVNDTTTQLKPAADKPSTAELGFNHHSRPHDSNDRGRHGDPTDTIRRHHEAV